MKGDAETPDPLAQVMGIRITPARRAAFFLTADAGIITASVALALLLRTEGVVTAAQLASFPMVATTGVVAGLFALYVCGVYRAPWSYVGLRDVARIAAAVAGSTLLLLAFVQMSHVAQPGAGFPRSVAIIQAPISFCALSGFRLSKRAVQIVRGRRLNTAGARTLIVGAGEAGAQVLESIHQTGAPYHVLGFVDDDPLSHRTAIHGARVLGAVRTLPVLVARMRIDTVIICPATTSGPFVQQVVRLARDAGVKTIRLVPPLDQIVDGKVTINATRDVRLEDLLGRTPVRIAADDLASLLAGRRVLVTGAAGTIGSELTRQIAGFRPARLVLVDVDESRLHDLGADLRHDAPGVEVRETLVDVREMDEVEELMHAERPDLVFHAAAYKHVPMMEKYPIAALQANVLGTVNVATAAEEAGCGRFVLISTDKAVEPSSVMGASKRLAEVMLFAHAGSASPRGMVRTAVRFGNVIGSRGSVIPLFERQIKAGGPLTVTHPDMERFFMMTSEAASLVLQGAALGRTGELYILEMGKPVRILDVAREFVRLHGLRPGVDITIAFTGLRPGEKLAESLNWPDEPLGPTAHPMIRKTTAGRAPDAEVTLQRIRQIVAARDPFAASAFLREQFPTLVGAQSSVKVLESPDARATPRERA